MSRRQRSVDSSGGTGCQRRVSRPKRSRPLAADARRRAYRALNEDGLVDLGFGLGLSFAALYVGLDRLAGVRLVAWYGLFPVLVAAVLVPGFVVADPDYGLMTMLGFPGIVLLATGIACFVRFLRRHPRPGPEGSDGAESDKR